MASDRELRSALEDERERLAAEVEQLRSELGEATDIAGKLRTRLPVAAAGAFGVGFVVAGGIGAAARLAFRRGREPSRKAKVGPISVVGR